MLSVIEDKCYPLAKYVAGGQQLLGERQFAVVHLERIEGRDYPRIARHLAAVAGRAPLLGRVSTVVDGTGVGRAFTDMIREAGVSFTPVTITGGGGQSRGENAYWSVSKIVLLSGARRTHRERPVAHHQLSDGAGADRGAEQLRGRFHVGREHAVDARSKDHHGDLAIATALALWSAVGRPRGFLGEGKLDHWF